MNRFFSLLLVSIFLLFPNYCKAWPWDNEPEKPLTTNEQLDKQKSEFQELLNSFSSSTIELKTEVEDGKQSLLSFKEAVQKAVERNVEFKKVYKKWADVESKNDFVKTKFEALVKGADEFYKAAESHANTIHDATLKSDAMRQIQTSKEAYIVRLKSTRDKLEEVSKLKIQVDDTMKYLEITQSIKVIEEKIDEAFKDIETLISTLMKELGELKIESQNLLNKALPESQPNAQ